MLAVYIAHTIPLSSRSISGINYALHLLRYRQTYAVCLEHCLGKNDSAMTPRGYLLHRQLLGLKTDTTTGRWALWMSGNE